MAPSLAALCLASWLLTATLADAQQPPKPETQPVLEITQSITLDPAKTYGPIVIKASNITVDGRGAWVVGIDQADAKDYQAVGVAAKGVSGVTLRNLNIKHWQTGLKIEDGSNWVIENCNVSDNFHCPAMGWHWGDFNGRGGIVLKGVSHSKLLKNKAKHNWDACELVHTDDILVENNDFSHCSNTCMWLWTACRNQVKNNNLSYGIRVNPGEVHARDSACVLVEDGSDDNHFTDNDITYGGDGVFIRGTGGWGSHGNVFERNDCSYAHNNCFESQSPAILIATTRPTTAATASSSAAPATPSSRTTRPVTTAELKGLHFAPWTFTYVPGGRAGRGHGHLLRRQLGRPRSLPRQQVRRQQRRRHRHLRPSPPPRPATSIAHWIIENNEHPRQPLGHLHGVGRLDRHRRQHVRSQLGRQHRQGRHGHQFQAVRRQSPDHQAAHGGAGRPLGGRRGKRGRAGRLGEQPIRAATRSRSAGIWAMGRSPPRRASRTSSRPPATTTSA